MELPSIQPMNPRDFMGGIALMILHAAAFNVPFEQQPLEQAFRLACAHVPGDLFLKTVRETLAEWTCDFRLPQPGHILAKLQPELHRRHAQHREARERQTDQPRLLGRIPTEAETQAALDAIPDPGLQKSLRRLGDTLAGMKIPA